MLKHPKLFISPCFRAFGRFSDEMEKFDFFDKTFEKFLCPSRDKFQGKNSEIDIETQSVYCTYISLYMQVITV